MAALDLKMLCEERATAYTGMQHESLQITAELSSPIAGALPWISLDGLLAWAVVVDLLGGGVHDHQGCGISQFANIPLPLTERESGGHQIFAASFALYQSVESLQRYRKQWCAEHDHFVSFTTKRAHVQTNGLFFKLVDMPTVLRDTRRLLFYAHGDRREIERLLNSQITHIGKRRAAGHGAVREWSIKPADADYSCWRNGIPMRPIPIDGTDKPGVRIEFCRFRPPYWSPLYEASCWVP